MTAPSRTGGQILVDQLLVHGVDHIFCVPGESYLAALDALHDADIAVTVCRQEGGAAMMAEAHGKLTGRPGICFVTRGPGATNASPGLHIAKQDSTPMILFVGQIERGMREREAFQELDYRAAFGAIVKWATEVDDPARFPEIVSRAFHVATSGRPGPVVIALPEDVLTDMAAVADAPRYEPIETAPSAQQIGELQALLESARNPIVLLGGSRWSPESVADFARFAGAFQLPVACTFRRQMLFSADHPSYAGDLGLGVNPKLLARIKDFGSGAGCRHPHVGNRQPILHAAGHPGLGPEARSRSCGCGRTRPRLQPAPRDQRVTGAVRGRARGAQAVRHARLERRHEDGACGLSRVERPVGDPPSGRAADGRGHDASAQGPAGRDHLLQRRRQFRHLGASLLAVSPDTARSSRRPPARWATAFRRRWARSGVQPDSPVVVFAGDGDFLMNGQEFATAVQYDLPILVILLDNGMYGTIRMHQERDYPGRVSATLLKNPDFAAYAKAFGGHGERVERTEEFAPALERALASGKPAILHCMLDPEAITPSMSLTQIREKALAAK